MSKKRLLCARLLFALSISILIFSFPEILFESIKVSWNRCINALLPSIFPMSVVSKQIYPYLFIEKGKSSDFVLKLFGFEKDILPVFFTSLLCGYPIPAIIAADMLSRGELSPQKAKKVTLLCNNPSPSFLIFFVGKIFFSSCFFGFLIFCCQTMAVVLCARFYKCKADEKNLLKMQKESLSQSVSRSAISCVSIFGFVIFFSLCKDLCANLLRIFFGKSFVVLLVSGLFEATSGIASAGDFPPLLKLVSVCFFSVFGGASVFFQVKSATSEKLFSAGEYIRARLFVYLATMFFAIPLFFLSKSSLL